MTRLAISSCVSTTSNPHKPPFGVFNCDLVVDDADPDRFIGSAFDDNAVPAGVFKLGRKPPAPIAAVEPFDGIIHRRQALHFAAPDTGDKGAGKRRGHDGYHIPGIEGVEGQLIADQLKENGGADSMAAAEFLIFRRVERTDDLRRQINAQYFSGVSACHLILLGYCYL